MKTSFQITSLGREDLKELGFNASNISGGQIERMAEQMSDAFCECCYWPTLEYLADTFNLPRECD